MSSPSVKPNSDPISEPQGVVRYEREARGGLLKRGGTKGKSGRRPALIRQKALRDLQDNQDVITQILKGVAVRYETDKNGKTELKLVSVSPYERIAAATLLAKLGMGEMVSTTDVRGRLRQQIALLRTQPTWDTDALLERLGEVWK